MGWLDREQTVREVAAGLDVSPSSVVQLSQRRRRTGSCSTGSPGALVESEVLNREMTQQDEKPSMSLHSTNRSARKAENESDSSTERMDVKMADGKQMDLGLRSEVATTAPAAG